MANGRMTRLTDTEFTLTSTVQNMKDTGKMICSTVMVWKHGLMVQDMKVTIKKVKSMEEAPMSGPMGQNTLVTGLTTRLMDKVYTHGSTVVLMKAHGRIIICMDKAHTHGVTVENMKESTIWTKSMATVSISGLMVVAMKVTGKMGNNTVKENIFYRTV